ncbi:MAG: o-succinylbenzoate synthase [Verrucomicrobia bacterium]|nr:o-succinylbenzoate synthase [Verrucomicrobiota bacterium]
MRFRFQFRRYLLPLRVAVRTAHGVWSEREGLIVRLENEAGIAGCGEAAPIPAFGTETVDEVEAACRDLGEWADDARLASVPARLACLRNGIATARAAFADTMTAKAAHKFIGVAALLPAGRAALALVGPKAESGFRVFKWKVGVGDVADELSLLDDLCAALPSGATLRLDANGAWDRRRAERWLERCAERPVEFVEQPCFAPRGGPAEGTARRSRDEDLLLGLANDWPTPIALDESLIGGGDIERWVGAGWPGVFVVKPALLGDVAGALAQLAKARAHVVFSSALETAVGARAALRAAFAWPGEVEPARSGGSPQPRALGFGVWPLFADGRFDGPAAAPFLRAEDVERINVEAVWTALS